MLPWLESAENAMSLLMATGFWSRDSLIIWAWSCWRCIMFEIVSVMVRHLVSVFEAIMKSVYRLNWHEIKFSQAVVNLFSWFRHCVMDIHTFLSWIIHNPLTTPTDSPHDSGRLYRQKLPIGQ